MTQASRCLRYRWPKYRFLVLGLTAPLLLLSLLFLFLARPLSPSDLLLNLATDLATIVVTIWYVDWALRKHEDEKWRGTRRYISSQAGGIAHRLITAIVEPTGLSDVIYPSGDPPLYKRQITDIQQEILANVRLLDRDLLIARLDRLTPPQWRVLMQGVRELTTDISSLIAQFASRLDPSELEAVLDLRRDIDSVHSAYDLFRPFLGVPAEQLPKMKDGRPWELAAIATIRIGIELRMALDQALSLIAIFRYVAEDSQVDWNEETAKSWAKYVAISRFQSKSPSA